MHHTTHERPQIETALLGSNFGVPSPRRGAPLVELLRQPSPFEVSAPDFYSAIFKMGTASHGHTRGPRLPGKNCEKRVKLRLRRPLGGSGQF
jgi:hypothetical protein